ncbi:MAG: LytR/AlgR family response regulator transcription factor [Aristaeellaceae bacterium]
MDAIKVIIADDNEDMRRIERKMIGKVEGFELVGEAKDGLELLELVEKLHPQIVFLDVEMPGKTGVEAARVIQDMDPGIIMIFATAHDQYMGDAFEVYAFDYLIKPFKVDRVLKTLERARDRLNPDKDEAPLPVPAAPAEARKPAARLMLHHKEGVSFVNTEDIVLIQREDRATVIYTAGDDQPGCRYVTGDSLSETEARLDPNVFFRCHKSYIINLNYISNITPYGRWTYVVRLKGIQQDALITHEKYEELEKLFS